MRDFVYVFSFHLNNISPDDFRFHIIIGLLNIGYFLVIDVGVFLIILLVHYLIMRNKENYRRLTSLSFSLLLTSVLSFGVFLVWLLVDLFFSLANDYLMHFAESLIYLLPMAFFLILSIPFIFWYRYLVILRKKQEAKFTL